MRQHKQGSLQAAAAALVLAAVGVLLLSDTALAARQLLAHPADFGAQVASMPASAPGAGIVTPSVVGGAEAPKGRFKHQLGMYVQGICGASLISPHVAITAGHCFPMVISPTFVGAMRIYAGGHNAWFGDSNDGTEYRVAKVVRHPGFDAYSLANDVTLVFLDQCVEMGPNVQPIKLGSAADMETAKSSILAVSGWGTTSQGANNGGQDGALASSLQYGKLKYVDSNVCNNALGSWGGIDTTSMFCAGTVPSEDGGRTPIQDACQGDSGGPLLVNVGAPVDVAAGSSSDDRLLGIVSWGDGCGKRGKPGVYTHVVNHMDWINQELAKVQMDCPVGNNTDSSGSGGGGSGGGSGGGGGGTGGGSGSGNPVYSFSLASSSQNWVGSPSKSRPLGGKQATALLRCQKACLKLAKAQQCAAYSVSVAVTSTGVAARPRYSCDVFNSPPSRVCGSGDSDPLCGQASIGSYKLVVS